MPVTVHIWTLITFCITVLSMDYTAWIEDLIGTDSLRTASGKIGFAQSTITRQLSRNTLTPQAVIALCRAYGRKPVDGLVQTGYLNPWEIEGVGIDAALDQATNDQLVKQIMKRSDPEARYLFGMDETINPAEDADLLQFPSNTQGEDDTPAVEPEWDDMPQQAVADDSPEEGGTPDDYEP